MNANNPDRFANLTDDAVFAIIAPSCSLDVVAASADPITMISDLVADATDSLDLSGPERCTARAAMRRIVCRQLATV